MQVMASLPRPLPPALRNLQPINCTCHVTPTIGYALLACAPIVPETWVPCPLSSFGSPVPVIALIPNRSLVNPGNELVAGLCHNWFVKSRCVYQIPVSITATMTLVEPVVKSHAA